MNTLLRASLVFGAALASLHSTQAQVLVFGNNNGVDTFADSTGTFASPVGNAGTRAISFLTGGASYTLDHVTMPLRIVAGTPILSVELWTSANLGTAPASHVANLSLTTGSPALSGTMTPLMFESLGLTLTANTRYWLVLQSDQTIGGTHTIGWGRAASSVTPTGSSGSGYYHGSTFSSNADDAGGTASTPGNIGNFAVYVTAVPEPHEYALIAGLGLCGFAVYRRRNAMVKA